MAVKNTKAVEEAKAEVKAKVDYKSLAESIEKAFKTSKVVDVVADTKREDPRALSESDFRYIHFFKAGTEKDLFGCYLIGKGKVRYALSLSVEEFLAKDLTVKPVMKAKKKGEEKRKVAVDVICAVPDAVDVAKKILEAYQQIPKKDTKAKTTGDTKAKTQKKSAPKKEKTA